MYLPSHFEQTRLEDLQGLIRDRPLATLVTLGSQGLNANHLPFLYDPEPLPFGTLRCHVARSNPVWRDVAIGVEALVIFQGQQAYVSPSWYETKRVSGKVVPTFNYLAVHAYGSLRAVDRSSWVRELVERLTERHEAQSPRPWRITDAPADFIDQQLRAIVGIEITLSRLVGKWKLSQNRSAADRQGVAEGLRSTGAPEAQAMAGLIEALSGATERTAPADDSPPDKGEGGTG